jgi:hypothetical protein
VKWILTHTGKHLDLIDPQPDKDCLTTGQANGATSNRRSAPLRCVEYLTDDGPDPLDGGDGPHYAEVS